MRKYIVRYRICVGIGLNQFFPEYFDIYRDTRKYMVNNTVMGSVSPKQFKAAHTYVQHKKREK